MEGIKSISFFDIEVYKNNISIERLKELIESGCEFSNDLYREFEFSSKSIKELEQKYKKLKSELDILGYEIIDYDEQNDDEENPYEDEYNSLSNKVSDIEREIGFRNKTIFLNSKYKGKDILVFGGTESNMYYNINIVYVDDLEKVYITNGNNMIDVYRNEIFDFYAAYDFLFVEQIVEVEWEDFICRGKIK